MLRIVTVESRLLWRHVKIDVDEDDELEDVIDKYCNAGAGTTKVLEIWVNSDFCNEDHMMTMATKLKKLKKLHYSSHYSSSIHTTTHSWLALPEPWTSLEELNLDCWFSNGQEFKWFHNDEIRDVDLHMSFPNLTLLDIEVTCGHWYPILLPDLSGCEQLESFSLHSQYRKFCVSFQFDLKQKVR